MKKNIFIILLFTFGLCFEKDILNKNYILLKTLNGNSNWILDEYTSDSIYISTKEIDGASLKAIKVEKKISAKPDLIKNIIMDVDNYDSFVSNPELLQSKIVDKSKNSLIAYQRIIVDIPMFNDRDYYFSMSTIPFEEKDTSLICYWMLLDSEYRDSKIRRERGITYLERGAGIWKWEYVESGKIKISYILYMHPGGFIPDFLIDIINESSIINLFHDVLKEINRRSM